MRAIFSKTSRMTRLASAIALASLATGCSQIPSYQAPEVPLPETVTLAQFQQSLSLDEQAWWQALVDESLADLLNQALAHNYDLAVIDQRLVQAQAAITRGRADSLPRLDAQAGIGRQQTSDNAFPTNQGAEFDRFTLEGLISYEVDLWGRVRANQQGLAAQFESLQADRQAARLSLMAGVAQHYIDLLALNEMVAIAQNTVGSREQNLHLRQRQFELGRLTPLAVQQAEVELSRVQVELIGLKQQRDRHYLALSLLVGDNPVQQLARLNQQTDHATRFIDHTLPALNLDLDAERLLQRPDVMAAEQRLIAANADIGQARARLFPSLKLNGLLGLSSTELTNLFDSDALQWQVSAGLLAPIFNAGSLRAQVQIAEAEQRIRLLDYQQTLRIAFTETLDALSIEQRTQAQLVAQQRQLNALRNSLDLAQKRFDAGYSSYLEVLDAQRALFDAEIAMVNSQRNQLNARIGLYKALASTPPLE
ncbi:efflux transporter outer membrane subunit [Thiomicrospira sp. ALE5]|uniref:efflux transporter outer membrane subunit n=1 Tax=Thiomicrospira sp. ALE5 TaxID=748650 RepID=UPI0008E96831|nr:efflux transporter outer membrane subunit [Thiomicrospira sp. ALE5]SFR55017.1 outer membrane protein, multidrug efflux system [Thiomicrospira sp. ALE5]